MNEHREVKEINDIETTHEHDLTYENEQSTVTIPS